jgi:O-antigen/teichoic acid export membrane protein
MRETESPVAAPARPPGERAVARAVRSGLGWKLVAQLVSQIVRLPVAVVVARTLTPREVGLAAMALVVAGLASLTSGFGADTALVQKGELDETDRSTAFWSVLAAGAGLAAAGAGLAPFVAEWFHVRHATTLFAVASLAFILCSLAAIPRALLTRELRFRELETGTIAAGLVGSAALVAAAVGGLGAWSFVLQQLSALGTIAVAAWIQCRWRPELRFSGSRLRALAPVSADVLITRASLGLARLIDNVIVGRFLGTAALGVYALAYNVMLLPSSRLTGPVQDVLYPVLARLQEERQRMLLIWERTTQLTVLVVVPAGIVVVAAAPELVRAIFGDRWIAAVPLIRVLAGAGVLQALSTGNLRLLVALDRSRQARRFAIAWLGAVLASAGIGVHWGILWVCVAYACATAAFAPVLFWLVADALELSTGAVLAPFRAVVVPALAMAGAVALVALAAGAGAGGAAAEITIGFVVYGAVWLLAGGGRARAHGLLSRTGA